jgi:hypothetical protein
MNGTISDALAEAPMSNADLLERNAIRLGSRTGSAFEVLPPRHRINWSAIGLMILAGLGIAALIGRFA